MALFADHDVTTIEDLAGIDHNVLSIAGVEGIDLTKKIILAQQLLIQEISRRLAREQDDAAAYHTSQVVSTPTLRLCHAFKAIELVYQEAFAGQGLERFERCQATFARLSENTLAVELEQGLAIASEPLPRPGIPTVGAASGVGPSGALEFSVSWMNQRGQESLIGAAVAVENSTGEGIALTPPAPPEFATAWLVYANQAGEMPLRQSGPLALDQTWTTGEQFVDLGRNDGGQAGDETLRLVLQSGRLRRG